MTTPSLISAYSQTIYNDSNSNASRNHPASAPLKRNLKNLKKRIIRFLHYSVVMIVNDFVPLVIATYNSFGLREFASKIIA